MPCSGVRGSWPHIDSPRKGCRDPLEAGTQLHPGDDGSKEALAEGCSVQGGWSVQGGLLIHDFSFG